MPLDRILEIYQDYDIKNVELGPSTTYIKNPLEILTKYDFNYIVHNYFPPSKHPLILNISSPNKKIRKKTIEYVINCINFCKKINSNIYSIHAGFLIDPSLHKNKFVFKNTNRISRLEAIKNMIETLSIIFHKIDGSVKIAVENNTYDNNLAKYVLLSDPEEIISFIKNINLELGLLLDVGHLNTFCHYNNKNTFSNIKKITTEIDVIEYHIHYNDGRKDTHETLDLNSNIMKYILKKDAYKTIETHFTSISDFEKYVSQLY